MSATRKLWLSLIALLPLVEVACGGTASPPSGQPGAGGTQSDGAGGSQAHASGAGGQAPCPNDGVPRQPNGCPIDAPSSPGGYASCSLSQGCDYATAHCDCARPDAEVACSTYWHCGPPHSGAGGGSSIGVGGMGGDGGSPGGSTGAQSGSAGGGGGSAGGAGGAAGVDGTFACGDASCIIGAAWCMEAHYGPDPKAVFMCMGFPAECLATPTCDCLAEKNAGCGTPLSLCMGTASTGVFWNCGGGG